jgi:hypothetical protein
MRDFLAKTSAGAMTVQAPNIAEAIVIVTAACEKFGCDLLEIWETAASLRR